LFEKEHSIFLNKLSEYHLQIGKMRIEKQELDSFEIQLKAEKEILSIKESEISNNLFKITALKNEVARERETLEKLVNDNSTLCKHLEFQKISIENTQKTLLLDRANTIQARLDFGDFKDVGDIEALRSTSNVPVTINTSLSNQDKLVKPEPVHLKMQLEAARIKQVQLQDNF
jgi:hypothetical protein